MEGGMRDVYTHACSLTHSLWDGLQSSPQRHQQRTAPLKVQIKFILNNNISTAVLH